MKKLLYLSLAFFLIIFSCKKDEDQSTDENNEVFNIPTFKASGEINFELDGEFNPSNLRIVSGFHEGVVSDIGGKTESDKKAYEINLNDGTIQLVTVLDGEEPLLQLIAVPSKPNEPITRETTAESMVFLHPLLATSDESEARVIKAAIKAAPSFPLLVEEVKEDLQNAGPYIEGNSNNYPSLSIVVEEVVSSLSEGFNSTPIGSGVELTDFYETSEEIKLKIKNKKKRWLKVYVDYYQNDERIKTEDYRIIQSEDFGVLDVFQGNFNFESISDEYTVEKGEYDEIILKSYGLGFSNVPNLDSEDFERAMAPTVGSLIFDFGFPIIEIIAGVKLKSELAGRPATFFTAFNNIVNGVKNDILTDEELIANLGVDITNEDYIGFAKEFLGATFVAFADPQNARYFGDLAKEILGVEVIANVGLRLVAKKILIAVQVVDYAFTAVNFVSSTHAIFTADMLNEFDLIAGTFISLKFIDIQGGTFDMGCTEEQYSCEPKESPVHSVTLSDFKLSKYEVTNFQYTSFLNDIGVEINGNFNGSNYIKINQPNCKINHNGSSFITEEGRENHPVVEVSWVGAKAYCEWTGGRLPTEAEWEYAARGGGISQNFVYSGSNTASEVAWYNFNSDDDTHEVGIKKANELDLHDMSGNLWEWCYDYYEAYDGSPANNPQGPDDGYNRVVRGGAYGYASINGRVSIRNTLSPFSSDDNVGFRCAKDF